MRSTILKLSLHFHSIKQSKLNSLSKTYRVDSTFQKITRHVPGIIYQFQYLPEGEFGKYAMPYANENLKEVFGISPDEVRENIEPIFDIIHPDDISSLRNSIEISRLTFNDWRYEFRIIMPDGQIKYLSGLARPEQINNGSVLWYGYIVDNTEKKIEEKRNNETRAKYQGYFENIPDGLFVVNRKGKYLEANPGAVKMTGYSEKELLTMTVADLVAPSFHTDNFNTLKKSFETGSVDEEIMLKKKNGEEIWIRLLTNKVNDDRVIAFCHDITQKKLDSKKLEEELGFHKLLSSITSHFVDVNFRNIEIILNEALKKTGGFFQADRCYIFMTDADNSSISKTYEWSREKRNSIKNFQYNLPYHSKPWWWKKLHNREVINILDLNTNTDLSEKDKKLLLSYRIKSVLVIPMKNLGKLIGFTAIDCIHTNKKWETSQISKLQIIAENFANIISKVHTEKLLKDSENRYRLLAENAKDVIFRIQLYPKRHFQYVSPSCKQLTGYAPEEYYNNPLLDMRIVHPEDKKLLENIEISTQKFRNPLKIRIIRKDGKIIWSEQSNAPVYDKMGNLIAIEGIARDITKQKEDEKQLKHLNNELKRKKKDLENLNKTLEKKIKKEVEKNRKLDQLMALNARQTALGEMIGNIAHQWRQPLNLLSLAIYDLEEAYDFDELDKDYLSYSIEEMNSIIQRMSSTIDDFRNYFEPQSEKTEFSAKELIDRAFSFLEGELTSKSVKIIRDVPTDILIFGYTNQLEQVVVNILKNALDALSVLDPEKRSISVKIKVNNNQYRQIEISNTGENIAEENMQKIFDPYFTTKSEGKGLGLGLYISKVIVEKNMKGSIRCENLEGGVKFSLSLPPAV